MGFVDRREFCSIGTEFYRRHVIYTHAHFDFRQYIGSIAGYWMADAVPLTEEPDEPVQLGYYDTEAELRQDYDRFLAALASGTARLFRFGSNY